MLLPFPHGQAEVCARDLAADCRNMAKRGVQLQEAIARGEASKSDKEEYNLLKNQIESLCNIVCLDIATDEQFRVGDYVTVRREMVAATRQATLRAAYEKLTKWLQ